MVHLKIAVQESTNPPAIVLRFEQGSVIYESDEQFLTRIIRIFPKPA